MAEANKSTTSPFSPYRADGKLYGFVCVVTGATQPIGEAIISELAACSHTPSDPAPSSLSAATKIIPYPLSPTDEQDTLTLIDDVLNTWGRLDVWVCSSGLLGPPSIDATTPADLQKCFETNSLAPFFALKYAPPAMGKLCRKGDYPNAQEKDERYGSIVVVSSMGSTYGGKMSAMNQMEGRQKIA
ncbi:MAG: hypothetical protein LQ351_005950 [Letrouitia transgressa]|nr:MAG: hypothetical protein LQ351_005950 [Letrouitia transgressa]